MKLRTLAAALVLIAAGLAGLSMAGIVSFDKLLAARPLDWKADTKSLSDKGQIQAEKHAQPPAISVAKVKAAPFTETVFITGSLVPRDEVLVVPEVQGLQITGYGAEVGDNVEKGQVLATLSKATLNAELDENAAAIARAEAAIKQAESQIAEAEANAVQRQASLKRAAPLKKSGYLSESIFDERTAAAKSAAARVRSAQDGLSLAKAEKSQLEARRRDIVWRLERTDIRAPTSGIISARTARTGAMASNAAEPLFRIISNGEFELAAEVSEAQLARVKPGQRAILQVTGAGTLTGKVRIVSPQIDVTDRLGDVRIFLGQNPSLKSGAFARGHIEVARSQGLAVPAAALLYDGTKPRVLRVENNRVQAVEVETGLRSGTLVEIRSGLSAGDIVVTKAGTFLRDGDVIAPVPPASAKVSEVQ